MKSVFIFLLGMSVMGMSHAQDSTRKIYLIRNTGINGFADPVMIFIDNKLVCKLNNDKYSIQDLETGSHRITVQAEDEHPDPKFKPLHLKIDSAGLYYVEIFITETAISEIACRTISETDGKKLLKHRSRQKNCP